MKGNEAEENVSFYTSVFFFLEKDGINCSSSVIPPSNIRTFIFNHDNVSFNFVEVYMLIKKKGKERNNFK